MKKKKQMRIIQPKWNIKTKTNKRIVTVNMFDESFKMNPNFIRNDVYLSP